jgi:hypothetical protein
VETEVLVGPGEDGELLGVDHVEPGAVRKNHIALLSVEVQDVLHFRDVVSCTGERRLPVSWVGIHEEVEPVTFADLGGCGLRGVFDCERNRSFGWSHRSRLWRYGYRSTLCLDNGRPLRRCIHAVASAGHAMRVRHESSYP